MSNLITNVFMRKFLLPFFLFGFVALMNAQTAGTLTVTFSTNKDATSGEAFSTAIYITTNTTPITLVNTLLYLTTNSDSSGSDMTTWWPLIGGSLTAAKTLTTTDAVTGATGITGTTQRTHYSNKVIYWGKTASVATKADGTYKVNFEIVNYKGISRKYTSGTFVKGPAVSNSTVTYTTGFSGITIAWAPTNTGINEVQLSNLYSVYPNPTKSSVFVSGVDIKQIELCDLSGKRIFTSNEQKINLGNLPKGTYLANIITEKGTFIKKIIKE